MRSKIWIYVIFFAVLLAGFYLLLPKEMLKKASLPVLNAQVPAFNFTDQNGKAFSEKNVEGKVYVAEFFFTTCKGICPKMNANMRRVFDAYKDEPEFMIVSHTCMPETDSVPLLKAYETRMIYSDLVKNTDGSFKFSSDSTANDKQQTANKNWTFVTGDKASLYQMARQGYLIDNNKPDSLQNINDQFIHTQFFALLDKNRRVRGIYDGLQEADIQKLLGDIKDLLSEKVDHPRFMNGFNNNPN
ncbi:MAG: SCO family protein [Chitinophagaceae bacterium]|nr:SCO family protein [Chitinophagaceae bacterium]